MVGSGLGIILGNLPALSLDIEGHGNIDSIIVYLELMFVMFTLAVYGYLATGAKWSYACLLWAGFGGVQMLGNAKGMYLGSQGHDDKWYIEDTSSLYLRVMDNFCGCVMILLVDILWASGLGVRTADQVAEAVPQCLDDLAQLVEALRDGKLLQAETAILQSLQGRIRLARYLDHGLLSALQVRACEFDSRPLG